MARSRIEAGIIESLGPRLDGWTVKASEDPQTGWVITLTHPASAGLGIETGTAVEIEALETGRRVLAASKEVDIASAAPALEHADLITGLRTVATMFGWDSREVAAVAFLMFEHGHLTLDETAWLSGYEGVGAPMQPRSPLG
ncbi:MAG: hypothetical protein AB7U39_21090 [Ilumatobacteraceae bacterium]